jgi:putative ABC transport system ATP-binding protein
LLGGLDSPTSGQILYQGEDITLTGLANHRRGHVAFIFQSYNLIDYLTPMENVSLTSKLPPLSILEQLGLTAEESRRNVLKLSGGQQQRVAIARALASNAQVILADEPTGNLDEDTADEITATLKDSAHKSGKCVVIVTHSNALAKQADVVLRLKKGVLYTQETK